MGITGACTAPCSLPGAPSPSLPTRGGPAHVSGVLSFHGMCSTDWFLVFCLYAVPMCRSSAVWQLSAFPCTSPLGWLFLTSLGAAVSVWSWLLLSFHEAHPPPLTPPLPPPPAPLRGASWYMPLTIRILPGKDSCTQGGHGGHSPRISTEYLHQSARTRGGSDQSQIPRPHQRWPSSFKSDICNYERSNHYSSSHLKGLTMCQALTSAAQQPQKGGAFLTPIYSWGN